MVNDALNDDVNDSWKMLPSPKSDGKFSEETVFARRRVNVAAGCAQGVGTLWG